MIMDTIVFSDEERLIKAANKGVDEYYNELKKAGGMTFDIVKCMDNAKEKAFLSFKSIYRKDIKNITRSVQFSMFEERFHLIEPAIRTRVNNIRSRFQKRLIIRDINVTSANAIIQNALEKYDFKAEVELQSNRIKLSLALNDKYRCEVYIKYNELLREGEMDRVIEGLRDIQADLESLNVSISIE